MPLHLLTSFDRGYIAKELHGDELIDVLRCEVVKCRLWIDDLDAFIARHRHHAPPHHKPDRKIKWLDYMTVTKDELAK